MKGLVKFSLLFLCVMAIAASAMAAEEPYPNRTVTMTHVWAAGGGSDLTCRAIATVGRKYFGQPIIVMPKPGGGGLVGLQYVASAKPDGYTIHFGRMGDMVNADFIEKMPFDMEKDFIPVCGVGDDELVVLVSAKSSMKTIEDLIAAAKKEPGKLKCAVAGTTSSGRLVFEAFANAIGVDIPIVPFKGEVLSNIATAGGHVPVTLSTTGGVISHVQRGELIPLMMMGNRRVKELPNVPIPSDKGWNFDMTAWYGLFVYKGTPPPVITKIESLYKQISVDPDFVKALNTLGCYPRFTPGKEFAVWLKGHRQEMGTLIKKLNLSNKD